MLKKPESNLERKAQEMAQHLVQIENLSADLESKAMDGQKMPEERETLKVQVDSLHVQKVESESHLERRAQEIAKYLVQIENLTEDLASKERENRTGILIAWEMKRKVCTREFPSWRGH